ncbi:TPA: hypothetical protein O1573_001423 [Staphylococcus aureus]|uniref:hypothetical protein n=1 Tax=Staphylococcus aureus TaxID=1280 RepID=UPI00044972F4|nr:hypothetical protein [Staphylococcus aureus]EXM54149.1 hypothetical protein W386_01623 [Staphylococcus aureus DAR116]CAC5556799.1 Uncharacterised protein [Staphylococcus aureus]CAC5702491.1 Uncharacterised protein [Staphylococcus aureus]CAC5708663.1 Uncharacterised protein [Staphylococcus aureus]CAC5763978.1 Uncharacterised protein [Staphylococcus aureus]
MQDQSLKLVKLQLKYHNLSGQIETYDKSLKEIRYTRDLFNKHLSMNNEDAFAGLEMVEDEITKKLRSAIKEFQKVVKALDKLNGVESDNKVTDLTEWRKVNQ